ncbi:hypothetical protein HHI36_004702, partial [Cryptolaemus montrouzieri]
QTAKEHSILKNRGYDIRNTINEKLYTRIDRRTGRKSILDHVATNYNCWCTIKLVDHCISDHRLIEIDVSIPEKVCRQKYQAKIVNFEKIYETVQQKLMNITPNVHNFKWAINTLQTAINDATSYTERRTTKNIKEGWFTDEVKRKMNERNNAYKI